MMGMKTVKRGRPRHGVNLKTVAERVKDSKSRSKAAGRKRREFVLNPDSSDLFEQLREQSGFSEKEGSAFLEALLLKVAGKTWYGPEFYLPIERQS
ncbi:hypothetical protein QTO08_00530 [Vibrio parahaemolyticus]